MAVLTELSYHDAVHRAADGKPLERSQLAAILVEEDKRRGDYDRDVEIVQRHRQLRAEIAELQSAVNKEPNWSKQINEHQAATRAIVAARRDELADLRGAVALCLVQNTSLEKRLCEAGGLELEHPRLLKLKTPPDLSGSTLKCGGEVLTAGTDAPTLWVDSATLHKEKLRRHAALLAARRAAHERFVTEHDDWLRTHVTGRGPRKGAPPRPTPGPLLEWADIAKQHGET